METYEWATYANDDTNFDVQANVIYANIPIANIDKQLWQVREICITT